MVEIELSITGTWLKDLPMKSPARCSTSSLASSISWSAHLLLFFIFSDFKFSWVSSWWVVSSGNSHYFSRVDTCWFPVLKLKKKNNPQKTKPNPQNTPKKPTKNLKQNQPTKKPPPQTLKKLPWRNFLSDCEEGGKDVDQVQRVTDIKLSSKINLKKNHCPSYFEESGAWKGIVVGLWNLSYQAKQTFFCTLNMS